MMRKIVPLLVLFVPQKQFEVYYSIIFVLLVIDMIQRSVVIRKYMLLFTYFAVLIALRTFLFPGLNDFKELVKVTFFLLVLSFSHSTDVESDFKYLKEVLFLFISANFIIVINQIFSFNEGINVFISNFYLAESQQILLTYDNIRATGLSPGVGQQGVIFLMLSMFFWIISLREKGKINYFLLICSVFILISSQSKTCFLAFLLFVLVRLVYSKNKYKYFGIPVFVYFIAMYYGEFLSFFKEYDDLIKNMGSSSFQARVHNWMEYVGPLVEHPVGLLLGMGRNYYSINSLKSSVFDSDYIYVLVNFGLVGIIIFASFVLYLFYLMKKFRLIIFIGLVVGLTINFFFEPKSFALLLIICSYLNNIRNDEKDALDIS